MEMAPCSASGPDFSSTDYSLCFYSSHCWFGKRSAGLGIWQIWSATFLCASCTEKLRWSALRVSEQCVPEGRDATLFCSLGMPNRKNISIVVVVDTPEQLAEYPLAQSTLHCYSTLHDYPLVILALSEDEPGWQAKCPQTDVSK